jgi:hypothetical protein
MDTPAILEEINYNGQATRGTPHIFRTYAKIQRMLKRIFLILTILGLNACDQVGQKLGLEDLAKKEAKAEQEAKAVGSACRQSGRAIEDCYSIYGWLPKAGIYTGWREMDEYMRENKLETIEPQLPPPEGPGNKKKKKAQDSASESDVKAETEKKADKH